MISEMETVRESALVRLRPEVMARAKRQAKLSQMSFNAFVEKTLEKALEPQWPVLPQDYRISDEILQLNSSVPMPSREQMQTDPRLKHILASYED